jgi:Putative beta barrel porin-7 (BBP7)
MRKGFLGILSAFCICTGWAQAEPDAAAPPAPADTKAAAIPAAPLPSAAIPDPDQAAPCCDLKEPCGPPGRFWVGAEYLLWWIKNDQAPPLVTTGPASFPVGFLGNPGTVVLDDGTLDKGTFSGARFYAGMWLNDCHTCGIEGSYFFLGQRGTNQTFNGPVLARPFFNQNTGTEFSEFAAFPGIATGQIAISSPSRLEGGDINFIKNCCCGCNYRFDVFGGFRYLELDESLNIAETSVFSPTSFDLPGATDFNVDNFRTQNRFYGGQLGADGELRRGKLFLDAWALVALGSNHEVLDIAGSQTVISPTGAVSVFKGGLLAEPSNIGHFTRDQFAVSPEVDLRVGYQVTRWLRASVGYTFLYINNVIRPGEQIDRVIDANQIPNFGATFPPVSGPAHPVVLFNNSDFWAQGIDFGLEIRW